MSDKRWGWSCYLLACVSPLLAAILTLSLFELSRKYVAPAVPLELALLANNALAATASAAAVTFAHRPRVALRVPLAIAFAAFSYLAAETLAIGGMATIYHP